MKSFVALLIMVTAFGCSTHQRQEKITKISRNYSNVTELNEELKCDSYISRSGTKDEKETRFHRELAQELSKREDVLIIYQIDIEAKTNSRERGTCVVGPELRDFRKLSQPIYDRIYKKS